MPSSVKGMSSAGRIMPMTPFWPWWLENLSPIMGTRLARSRTRASRAPSLFVVMKAASTRIVSEVVRTVEWSTTLPRLPLRSPPSCEAVSRLQITTSADSMAAPSAGRPSASTLS